MPRVRRRTLAALAVAVAGALLLWLSLNAAAGWILERAAARAGIRNADFDVKRLGLSRVILAHARFTIETDSDTTDIAMDDVSVRIAFSDPYVRAIEAGATRTHWRPRETIAAAVPIGPLVVPVERLAVRRFELVMDTAFGRSEWRGSLDARREPGGGTLARLVDASHTLELKLLPRGTEAAIRLLRYPAAEALTIELGDLDREHFRLEGSADLIETIAWLSASALVPDSLRNAPLLNGARNILRPQDRAVAAFKAVATSAGDLVEADAVLSFANKRLFSVNARRARNGILNIEAGGKMKASEALAVVHPLLPAEIGKLTFDRGTIRASGRLKQAKDRWSASAEVILEDAAGALDKLVFTGFDSTVKLDEIAPLQGSLTVQAARVDAGGAIALQDLRLRADRRGDTVRLAEAAASTLGGRLRLNPAVLDPARPPYDFTLSAEQLDFGQILALFQLPELSGSGLLDAQLPMRIAADRFEVGSGTVHGTTPGTLRYRVANADNIALLALGDLEYRSLEAALNYDRDGEYRVLARIVGRNPQLLDGHPVALNLNISGSLPRLLAAGLLSGDFSGHILKEIAGDRAEAASGPEQTPAGKKAQ